MKLFSMALNACLQETKTNLKIKILSDYFKVESNANRVIAFHLLMGESFGRFCLGKWLRLWCADVNGLPEWLINESYESLGDNSETISLCFGQKLDSVIWELSDLCSQMLALKSAPIDQKRDWVVARWQELSTDHIYVFNKLLGGGIRIGASKKTVLKALGHAFDMDPQILEQRLLGRWEPTCDAFNALIDPNDELGQGVSPFPFYLASPLPGHVSDMVTDFQDWQVEPKWDGIRAQLVHRVEGVALWSRGNDLITDQFPEIIEGVSQLPYGVYDGEILAWQNNAPLSFFHLQKRLNRKTISQKLLKDTPCVMLLYDCLESNAQDLREEPLRIRVSKLTHLPPPFYQSKALPIHDTVSLKKYIENARNAMVEGVIIKRLDSAYLSGRVRGHWWKLKVAPLTLDVVIMYVQKGRGIRSGLFTDYTFGVWDGDTLVPIGKAYSGLTNNEIREINGILKGHLTDRFGPVRGVAPCVVLEVAFDDIQPSSRHKSGLALRFPRIHRLRLDKPVSEANTLADARLLCQR
ncbi:MAG: cisplatin damage response ATP-dependent DNA ligase [Candidatus Margulisiibacteriota bacterium]